MDMQQAERREEVRIVPRVVGELRRADDKLVELVRRRPVATLCVAMAFGYAIGRVLTRRG